MLSVQQYQLCEHVNHILQHAQLLRKTLSQAVEREAGIAEPSFTQHVHVGATCDQPNKRVGAVSLITSQKTVTQTIIENTPYAYTLGMKRRPEGISGRYAHVMLLSLCIFLQDASETVKRWTQVDTTTDPKILTLPIYRQPGT